MVLFKRPIEPYVVEVDLGKEVYNVAARSSVFRLLKIRG